MKSSLIIPLTIACLLALPALAETNKRSAAADSKSIGYRWDKPGKELAKALECKGDAEKGEIAYETCRGCHKADASGRPDAGYPQLAGQHASVLIKQMIDVRTGWRDSHRMRPFIEPAVVPAQDIPDIAAYLTQLPVPTTNRKGDGNNLAPGKALYDRDCASCHGAGGEGKADKFYPKVASQHYPYLYRESMDIRDRLRRNANLEMVKVLLLYSDDDIAAVSDYMSRLPTPANPAR